MSWSANTARLESIHGVSFGAWAYQRFQSPPIGDIYSARKDVGQILRDLDIVVKIDPCVGLDLDQDINVAAGFLLAARDRAEHGRVLHPATAQFRLARVQHGNDL